MIPSGSVCSSSSSRSPASLPPEVQRMSDLVRFSSSSDTVRFPMYQNIQNTRLRKISKGPDSTKKSQKLRGAKIPTKKRMRPATSRTTASVMKKMGYFPCPMVAGSETVREVDVVFLEKCSPVVLLARSQHATHVF
ncbi:uncharacterized protein ACO6RY_02056 [Pungitius sinensis]